MFQLWKTCFGKNSVNPTGLREEFCGDNPTTEQYAMFRYTAIEDLAAVYAYRADRRLSSIVSMIKQKRWAPFLTTYSAMPEEAHFILMAAYRYGCDEHSRRLTAKEAATAFYFLLVAIDDPQFLVAQLNRSHHHFGLTEKRWASVPENEQVVIYIHHKTLTPRARGTLEGSIFEYQNRNHHYLAITQAPSSPYYELSSASILEKNIYRNSSKKMDINFGFPTRREYLNGIFNGENSYALLTPYSKSPKKIQYLHGVSIEKGSAWAARHDGAHLHNRHTQFMIHYTHKIFHNQFKKIIFALEDIYEARPSINSLVIEEGFAKLHLSKNANAEDLATRIIDELLICYIDAEAVMGSLKNLNIQEIEKECCDHLISTCKNITQTTKYDPHKDIVLNENNTDIIEKAIEIAANLVLPAIQEAISPSRRNKSRNP